MKTDDFDYELPERLIAQTPLEKRDDSKLMILDRKTGEIIHETFHNIINYLQDFVVVGVLQLYCNTITAMLQYYYSYIAILLQKKLQ